MPSVTSVGVETSPASVPAGGLPGAAAPRPRRLVRNVLSNWAFSLVELAVGFVLPRLISDRLGQELLGVWDVSWSLVFWVQWTSLGITGAVTRFVARYRALRDWEALNATVNTSLAFLLIAGLAALSLGVLFAAAAPRLLHGPDTPAVAAAGWVILLLTSAAGVQMLTGVFNAVITGHERFDLLNLIRCTRDIGVLLTMAALLIGGQGLATCAVVPLVAEVLAGLAKYGVARRICPSLRLARRHCRWATARDLGLFGGKTVLRDAARGGMYHLSNLLVAGLLGPAAVAVYSRQRTLVMYLTRFVKQYANVFIPASSELHAGGDVRALRHMLVDSGKYAFYIALPPIWLLVLLGGPLLEIWMGTAYAVPGVLGILAVGHALTIPQTSVYSLLMGMNRHGLVGLFEAVSLALGLGLGWLLIGPLQWGLTGAAVALTGPLVLSGGVLLPWYACRRLDLPLASYLRRVFVGPLAASLPLAACLLLARGLPLPHTVARVTFALLLGGLVTALVYWRWVVPAGLKARLVRGAERVQAVLAALAFRSVAGHSGEARP